MIQELFASKNGLVSHSEWISKINDLTKGEELLDSEEKIALEVKRLLIDAIKSRVENVDEVGICFSGGLDSSFIAAVCKKQKINFTCYNVGFQDGNMEVPDDITQAIKVAKFLKLKEDEFKSKIFKLKEIEEIIKKTAKIIHKIPDNPDINVIVNLGVGSVESAAHSISKNEKYFFSGLGSEEIFAGYDRHKNNPTNEECKTGLLKMYERDLLRDGAVSKALKFSFLTPFLDEKLAKYALKIPIRYKINSSGNKMILRNAAKEYLGEFSKRPKKAAQYGSSFDKAIIKLTSINGYEKKKEYYKSL